MLPQRSKIIDKIDVTVFTNAAYQEHRRQQKVLEKEYRAYMKRERERYAALLITQSQLLALQVCLFLVYSYNGIF